MRRAEDALSRAYRWHAEAPAGRPACPAADRLASLAERGASSPELLEHVSRCSPCAAELREALALEPWAREAAGNRRRAAFPFPPAFARWVPTLAAAAVLLLGVGLEGRSPRSGRPTRGTGSAAPVAAPASAPATARRPGSPPVEGSRRPSPPSLGLPAIRRVAEPLLYAGDARGALLASEAAAEQARASGDAREEGWALDMAGNALFFLGDYAGALRRLESAIPLLSRAGDREGVAHARKDAGIALKETGDYEAALATLEMALAELRDLGDVAGEGSALENTGMVYAVLSLRREAVAAFEEARRLAEASADPELLFGTLVRGSLLLEPAEALPRYRRAVELARAMHRGDAETWALLLRSETLDELGRHEEAAIERRTLRALAASRGDAATEAFLLRDEGRLALGGRDGRRPCRAHGPSSCPLASSPSEAARLFESARELVRPLGAPLWAFHAGLGEARLDLGDLPGAVASLRAAADDIEAVRARLALPAHRESFFGRFPRVYELLQEALLRSGDVEAAFEASERARARVLSEALRGDLPVRGLAARCRQGLPESTAVVSWVLGPEGGRAYVLTRGRPLSVATLDVPPAVLRARARSAADILSRDGELPPLLLGRLSHDLLGPVVRVLPASIRRLVAVPDGPLHLLPVEVLVSPRSGRRLGDDYETSYAPSVAVLAALLARPPAPTPRADLLLLAVPDGLPSAPLAGAAREADDVGSLGGEGSEVLVGPTATSARLASGDLSAFRVLHLATHAVPDPKTSMEPALALADGLLSAGRIARLGSASDLVVLSGCRTAGGPLLPGEGVQSLARAFFLAGARSVVASLWDVGDETTARFMASLYRHLARGEGRGAAIRHARLEVLASGLPARDALAFILIGDSGRPARVTGVTWYRRATSLVFLSTLAFCLAAWAVTVPRRGGLSSA